MRAYWEQARDIGDTEVLQVVAEEVSLNTKNFEQILASEAFDEQVTADVEMAHAYGLTGPHLCRPLPGHRRTALPGTQAGR